MSNAELFLPARLRELRNGKSQAEIARLCDIPQQNYNRYEAGTVKPKQEALRKIATHYRLTIEQLLDGHSPDHTREIKTEPPTTIPGLWTLLQVEFARIENRDKIIDDRLASIEKLLIKLAGKGDES